MIASYRHFSKKWRVKIMTSISDDCHLTVTQCLSLLKQEILTFRNSSLIFRRICIAQSFDFCVVFCELLAMTFSVIQCMVTYFPFDIFKLSYVYFLSRIKKHKDELPWQQTHTWFHFSKQTRLKHSYHQYDNFDIYIIRRVWRYQRGNQNPYIKEEQTTQWSKEKVQKNKQRSTKHTYKTKDRVTRTPLKAGDELRCSRKGKQFLLH
jgi:hypothetical protein